MGRHWKQPNPEPSLILEWLSQISQAIQHPVRFECLIDHHPDKAIMG
jgi:hypothetical protein